MRHLAVSLIALAALWPAAGISQAAPSGPNKVLKVAKVGGDGGFDYISADIKDRILLTPRYGRLKPVRILIGNVLRGTAVRLIVVANDQEFLTQLPSRMTGLPNYMLANCLRGRD